MKFFIVSFLLLPIIVFCQPKKLIIEGESPSLYITHTVAPKENYYSIGRLYNISPKEIAPFNNLQLEKGLSLNQVIKIPLMEVNFSQNSTANEDEYLVPLHHIVQDKEGLYRIGANYNRIPVEVLKVWNNLQTDAVANGVKLIVGYLKVKKDLSSFAEGAVKNTATNNRDVVEVKPKAETIIVKDFPKPEKKMEREEDKIENKPVAKGQTEVIKKSPGGYFKKFYENQNRSLESENGMAAVFKSTSGWEDGKYYCLHNDATPGSVIKITSTTTGKSIYAKVLDAMPDISRNKGILIRVSNAAATELGVDETKFDCTLSFAK